MLIRIHCPSPKCRKELRISAKHAGKKIACTGCGQKIRLPTAEELKIPVAATTAPAAANEEEQIIDYDLLATEAALGEQLAAESAAKETMIDFTCPMCDEPVQLAAEHSGKRAPCPSCRRIIQVPKVESAKPRDWREKVAQGPTLAKKTEEKLEGAWGNIDVARASQEALEEAKALPKVRRQLTPRDWVRYGVYAAVTLGVLLTVWWGYQRMKLSSAEASAVSGAEAALMDPSIPPETRALLQRALGEWFVRFSGSDEAVRKGLAHLRDAGAVTHDPLWVWILSMDLARLLGQQVSLDPKQTAPPIDPQTLQKLVSQAPAGEPREEIVRALSRSLLEKAKGDPEKLEAARNLLSTVIRQAVPATGAQPTADYAEQLSCLGVLAQELLRVQARDQALEVIGRVPELGGRNLYKKGMHVPHAFVAAMTALSLPDLDVDAAFTTDFELAKMVGYFRAGRDGQGGELMSKRITVGYPEVNFLPFLELAEYSLEADRQQEALVRLNEAMKIAEIYTERRDQHWKLRVYGHVRLCALTARAGEFALAEQRVQKLKLDSDPNTAALARALIARHKHPEGDADTLLAGIPARSSAQALAAFELARKQAERNSSISPPVTTGLPEGAVDAAGRLGALLGYKSLQKPKP